MKTSQACDATGATGRGGAAAMRQGNSREKAGEAYTLLVLLSRPCHKPGAAVYNDTSGEGRGENTAPKKTGRLETPDRITEHD